MSCGDPIWCQCPAAWWGIMPPYCPLHNPGYSAPYTTITTPNTVPVTPGLPPEDIEKIARRVAELLRGG